MFVTTHVLSGAGIGLLARRPLLALVAGAGSHLALDRLPHWGTDDHRAFLVVAVADGLTGLAVSGTLAAGTPPALRLALTAGMLGAALPDADKPARLFFGRSPFPARFDRFHARIQPESPRYLPVDFAVTGALLVALLLARSGRARSARARSGRR